MSGKGIDLNIATWFLLKNQWLTAVLVDSRTTYKSVAETEKAIQMQITRGLKQYLVWMPKSALI